VLIENLLEDVLPIGESGCVRLRHSR
jgi:hypothetical protein